MVMVDMIRMMATLPPTSPPMAAPAESTPALEEGEPGSSVDVKTFMVGGITVVELLKQSRAHTPSVSICTGKVASTNRISSLIDIFH